ncbi:MAG: YciI family protein [Burkholderiaceae bacterium]
MPYLVHCLYREGGAQARLPIRRAHIAHMLAWLPRTVFGGAVKSPGGEFLGMIVVLDVAAEAEARAFLDDEPYARAGLFGSTSVLPLAQMTPPHTREVLERELEKCA